MRPVAICSGWFGALLALSLLYQIAARYRAEAGGAPMSSCWRGKRGAAPKLGLAAKFRRMRQVRIAQAVVPSAAIRRSSPMKRPAPRRVEKSPAGRSPANRRGFSVASRSRAVSNVKPPAPAAMTKGTIAGVA